MIALAVALHLVLNPAVNQATIHKTICVRGWTATVRPTAAYTTSLKRRQLPPGSNLRDFEEDHVIPLVLGGHPTDPRNLRPQLWPEALVKDREEKSLARAVCRGRMTLRAAQVKMAGDWP